MSRAIASHFRGPQRSPSSLLWDWWVRATPDQRLRGRLWYPNAFECANRVATVAPSGVGPARAAGVISALSPGTRWETTERMALAAAKAQSESARQAAVAGAYPRQRLKALKILVGRVWPGRVLTGPKEHAFWRAIIGDPEAVVIDRWAARAAGFDPERITPPRWDEMEQAYRDVAAWVHETPRDFQAIVWTVIREAAWSSE